mmetsp:Transcript_33050/g.77293  ORF Transcript_33050/g.77293 Transcript_33050/m.77293 type:complete len:134 (+) Transcript_33050:100-501(+)|eukprot:CAMPEP_0178388304 /NCGR_PEP_ID=MMETSP0689_2-20121128/9520_1 /TAXON_ID=160604 /ORGANISM="Amphidinium massartii, Strain CS-259" /LENGTH=133 /DNA_ID=CAMNT_0020008695 /DNA_START=91 /DNA_END=492 /DNA_ORIENTATION=+
MSMSCFSRCIAVLMMMVATTSAVEVAVDRAGVKAATAKANTRLNEYAEGTSSLDDTEAWRGFLKVAAAQLHGKASRREDRVAAQVSLDAGIDVPLAEAFGSFEEQDQLERAEVENKEGRYMNLLMRNRGKIED